MSPEYKMQRWGNQELFHRILQGATTPLEMTLEILLWRGFLATAHNNKLYLATGSHIEDLALLRRFLKVKELPVVPRRHRTDAARASLYDADEDTIRNHVCCRIEPTGDMRVLYRILTGTFRSTGMIGSADFSRGPGETRNFGRRVPVVWLDPGVALLTKALPLLKLEVWYSCEGHPNRKGNEDPDHQLPEVRFSSIADLRWARAALPQFLPPGDAFVKRWRMRQGTGWSDISWFTETHDRRDDPEAVYNRFWDIQRLCRNILDSHWDEQGRFNLERSLAFRARMTCGNKANWAAPDCWDNPERYLFSREHIHNSMTLPRYEEILPPRTINRGRLMPERR